ncbi:MAG: glycogen/starch synthase [Bacteroidota bacterium]
MPKLRILYAASEIDPYLQHTTSAKFLRALSEYTQERGAEIRILVPRFGLINGRKNKLHEVVRLSGVNIKVGDAINALSIKVASIPGTKLQVYFIDNEEYFKRKALFRDKHDHFFKDNDERIIFFCKSVLETAKRLGWPPDAIHCHDWMTSLVPVYLKTVYRGDPTLKDAKLVWTLYNNVIEDTWSKDMVAKAHMDGMPAEALGPLATADCRGLIKAGLQYADVVSRAEALTHSTFEGLVNAATMPCMEGDQAGMEAYYNLYQEFANARA